MAEISLKINGVTRNVNLTDLDWSRAQQLNATYGTTPLDTDDIGGIYDCIMQTTLNSLVIPTGADNKMFIFRSTHAGGALLSNVRKLSEQLGTRPVYFGARQKTGDDLYDFYDTQASLGVESPPANTDLDLTDHDFNIFNAVDNTWVHFNNYPVWRSGADTSGYLVNMNAIAHIETMNGGSFGVSLCAKTGIPGDDIGTHVVVWSYGNYTYHDNSGSCSNRGNYYNEWLSVGYYPMYGGASILNGVPLGRSGWNAEMGNKSFGADDHTLQDDVSAEMVYTEINGNPYLGMAACKWVNDTITEIDVCFLPAWFWGQYQVPEDPTTQPQYHGLDATTDRTSGTYSYTMADIDLPTAAQPFSAVAADAAGLHVYRITTATYNAIQESLWGSGTIGKALWDRFVNYKFNPIAGILGCHIIPKAFMPTVTNTFVQPRASGSPLIATSDAKYLNTTTTITETARTINMPKFFSSHLNWDPFTSVQLFLPFCGWVSIPADRCVDTDPDTGNTGSISVQYRCDIITGNVTAFIRCFDGKGKNTFSTQATGNCAIEIPMTGNDNGSSTVMGAITAAAGVAVGAMTGGLSAAATIAGAAATGLATQTARHNLQQATQYSGNIAALGCLCPYLFVTIPTEHTSEEFRNLHGLPSGVGLTVGQMNGTGYTELSEFHAEFDCTAEEQQEIEAIMKGGVIL